MTLLRRTCLLCALLVCAPAAAEPLVIYGPGSPTSDLAARAVKVVEDNYGVTVGVERLVHVNEVPFPAAVPLWMMGDSEVIPCRGASITAAELTTLLEEAEASEGEMDWGSAQKVLDDAQAALSCSGEIINKDLLWRLFFIHGAIAYFDGRTGEASDHFRMALGIDPAARFDPNFPPQVQAAYLNAREELQLAAMASFSFLGAKEGITEIWLDGAPIPIDPGGATEMHPGYHLIQYRSRLNVVYSVPFKIKPAGEATLVSGSGYSWAILTGDSDPKAQPIAEQALGGIPGAEDAIYVVSMDDDAYLYRYDPVSSTFDRPAVAVAESGTDTPPDDGQADTDTPPDDGQTDTPPDDGQTDTPPDDGQTDVVDPPDDPSTTTPTTPNRRFGVNVGGGALVFIGGTSLVWAGPSIDLVGRIAGGLHIDGGFRLGVRGSDVGVNIFPVGRIGIRYAFTNTVARPYVGGLFALGGGNASTGPRPGGLLAGGVMIEPGAGRHFRITIEVAGGYVGGGVVGLNVGVGPIF
jgi:hypothetical protein